MTAKEPAALLSPDQLVARLREEGVRRYHDQHPFHQAMHAGALTPEALRTWTANRFYYQTRIPIKDALIVAKSEDPAFRRAWLRRIQDHDGQGEGDGGLELWLKLAEAVGLEREAVINHRDVLPGVRFACDSYVMLVRDSPLPVAVASSLTEMFAGQLIALRMDAMRQHYPWIVPGLAYFEARLTQSVEDSRFALDWVTRHALTREQQELAIGALRAKCDILWAQLDAIYYAYVQPGWPPPGAFRPEGS